MALVGFWQGLRRGDTGVGLVRRTLGLAVVGFGLQGLVLLVAVLQAAGSDGAAAQATLVRGPTLLVATAVVWVAVGEARRRRASERRPEPAA